MKELISVHHVRETNVDAQIHIYCGREGACKRSDLLNGGLGNPHWMKDETQRGAVCEAYAKDLRDSEHPHWKRIERIALRLTEGKKVALYCFCAPKQCHCDTIAENSLVYAELTLRVNQLKP